MSGLERTRHRLRRAMFLVVACALAPIVIACSGGGSAASSGGSATSGTVNWWGWSPSAQGAQAAIAAFNKVYPNIKVNYKLLPVTGVAEAMRPALAAGALGPDVFDVTPGPELTSWGEFALDLTPTAEKALGPDWKSKLAAGGIDTLTTSSGKFAALSIGSIFAGTLWINENLFQKYGVTPPTTLSRVGLGLRCLQGARRRVLRPGRRLARLQPGHAAGDRRQRLPRHMDRGHRGEDEVDQPCLRQDPHDMEVPVHRRGHGARGPGRPAVSGRE